MNGLPGIRTEWDSNPRWTYTHASFQDWCLKPLGHPSNASGKLATYPLALKMNSEPCDRGHSHALTRGFLAMD
jgi:hypothetical protein